MRQSESEAGRLDVFPGSSNREVTYLEDFTQGGRPRASAPFPLVGRVLGLGGRTPIQVPHVPDQA